MGITGVATRPGGSTGAAVMAVVSLLTWVLGSELGSVCTQLLSHPSSLSLRFWSSVGPATWHIWSVLVAAPAMPMASPHLHPQGPAEMGVGGSVHSLMAAVSKVSTPRLALPLMAWCEGLSIE